MNEKETLKQYIQRMTGTKGELFKPTGWINVRPHTYRNITMLFVEVYTDCIYKSGQPIAKLWMKPMTGVHLAWELLEASKIWNKKSRANQGQKR